MFGASPGTYKNKCAAHLACIAYMEEEQNDWIVMKKVNKGDNEDIYWYTPCRKDDIIQAIEDKWLPLTTVVTDPVSVVKAPIDITSFAPTDVAGFELSCTKNPNGSFSFKDHMVGELPKEVKCNDIIYTLASVNEFDKKEDGSMCANALYSW